MRMPRQAASAFDLGLGDRQHSLGELGKAYEVCDPWLLMIKIGSIYDPLRSDPRFVELLRKMNLDNGPMRTPSLNR
jgi:hypothetical protein